MFLCKTLQASRQSALPDEVVTIRSALKVLGFADRLDLPQKILKFCGTFPIYEVEIEEIPLDAPNTTLTGMKTTIYYLNSTTTLRLGTRARALGHFSG